MDRRNVPVRILVSGLTAAGKSTHCRLLAAHYEVPYISMRSIMATVLREQGLPGAEDEEWSPSVDEARAPRTEVDREADRRMLQRIHHGPGVFDAWALPWLYRKPDAVRVWIAADLPSRMQRCRVSAAARDRSMPDDPAALLRAKDKFSRARFRSLYGFDLQPSPEVFDLIAENSGVLLEQSEHFSLDIDRFHRELVVAIDTVLEGGTHQRASCSSITPSPAASATPPSWPLKVPKRWR